MDTEDIDKIIYGSIQKYTTENCDRYYNVNENFLP